MPIWKWTPVDTNDENWALNSFAGTVIVRADGGRARFPTTKKDGKMSSKIVKVNA